MESSPTSYVWNCFEIPDGEYCIHQHQELELQKWVQAEDCSYHNEDEEPT